MEMKIYSIRDTKGDVYNPPFFSKTHGEAERSFRTLINDPKSMCSQYPEDFDLWHLGTFNSQSGDISPLVPTHVQKGIVVKQSL